MKASVSSQPRTASVSQRRVMYVVESFSAGALTALLLMAWEMHERGWDIIVVHGRRPQSPAKPADLLPPNTKLRELCWSWEIHPTRDLAAFLHLRALFRTERPTVIHLISSKAGAVGRLAAWPQFSRRVVYSPQAWSFLGRHRSAVARQLYRLVEWFLGRLGGVIVVCSEGERLLAQSFAARCVLVENALRRVDRRQREVCDRSQTPPVPWIVGTIGRICEQKDPRFFVDVVRKVVGRNSDVQFVWVGDGELRPVLAAARDEGLPITITGWIEPHDVTSLLITWSLYLQTSRYEGMPFAILEALAAGIPVLARDVVGNRDAVRHGATGSLFNSTKEAASAILRYLDDQALWHRTSDAARNEAATRFSSERLGDQLATLYASVSDGEC